MAPVLETIAKMKDFDQLEVLESKVRRQGALTSEV